MGPCIKRSSELISIFAFLLCQTSETWAFDMGDCPFSSLSFRNNWSDDTFIVERVAEEKYYYCDDDFSVTRSEGGAGCIGPFGGVLLVGTLTRPGEEPREFATQYQFLKASPCCGWRYVTPSDAEGVLDHPNWHSDGEGPVLSDWPVTAIWEEEVGAFTNNYANGEGSEDLLGLLAPMICRLGSS
jgi:hypothetical protein